MDASDPMDETKNQLNVFFMKKALLQAAKAGALLETPIGAVIVKDGVVVASGYNQRESRQDTTLHAELTAIRKACRRLGSWRLDGCDLYVTLEPCIMCAGAIQQARMHKVYFGAKQPKSGGVVSKAAILDLDLNHDVEYQGGLLAVESESLMKEFFSSMRAKDKSTGLTKGQRRNVNKRLDPTI
ncbi:MAG: nucleoside deaminase [Saccharofermentanales bacterium]